jgi:hypothetical protein
MVPDLIAQTRLRMIQEILDPFRASLDMLLQNCTDKNAPAFLYCNPGNSQNNTADIDHCRALVLGSVSKALAALELWPIPDDNSVSSSPKELGSNLTKMTILHMVENHTHQHSFNKDIEGHVNYCMETEPERTDFHKAHLEAQAEKTDVGSYVSNTLLESQPPSVPVLVHSQQGVENS